MVAPEELEALDLICWFGNCHDAAQLAHCNQSTISRRSQHVLKLFKLNSSRHHPCHPQPWSTTLLRMEREVHQLYRLSAGSRLRLHVPYWASRLLNNQLAPSWILNPAKQKEPVGSPLRLLEDRVIDAWIAEPAQRPADDDTTFACFDLYQAPLQLCSTLEADNPLLCEANLSRQDVGLLASFESQPFLSPTTKECGLHLFGNLYGDPSSPCDGGLGGSLGKKSTTFLISPTLALPEFSRYQTIDCECGFEAKESLVVLRGLAESPAILGLLEMLSCSYISALRHCHDVIIDRAFV